MRAHSESVLGAKAPTLQEAQEIARRLKQARTVTLTVNGIRVNYTDNADELFRVDVSQERSGRDSTSASQLTFLFFLGFGQAEIEGAPLTLSTFGPDASAMGVHHLVGNGES